MVKVTKGFAMFKILRGVSLVILVAVGSSTVGAANFPEFSRVYDPARDPFADFDSATGLAAKSGKKVLVEVGGNWCSWCHIMEDFLGKNPSIRKSLHATFIILKVNISDENRNEKFLSYLPEIRGVPHFVVVNSEGKVLGEQNTAHLEQGSSYSPKAFMEFIARWRD